jgi:hypothetical protein
VRLDGAELVGRLDLAVDDEAPHGGGLAAQLVLFFFCIVYWEGGEGCVQG